MPLACLLEFGFAQLFKLSQRCGHYAPVVVSANYLTLSLVLGIGLLASGRLVLTPALVQIGVTTGLVFICAISVMTRALLRAGVAPVLTAFRMAVVLPIVGSVLIWHEPVSSSQVAGVGAALLALLLMTAPVGGIGKGPGHRVLWTVFPVFCCQGVSHTCLRWAHHAGLDGRIPELLFVVGGTAGLLGALRVAWIGHRPKRGELLMGCGIGLYNLVALTVILTALSRMAAAVFFPVLGCTVVVLDNLSAHLYWKELLSRPAMVGAAMAVLAILLVLR